MSGSLLNPVNRLNMRENTRMKNTIEFLSRVYIFVKYTIRPSKVVTTHKLACFIY